MRTFPVLFLHHLTFATTFPGLALLSLIIFPMVPGHQGTAGSDCQVKGQGGGGQSRSSAWPPLSSDDLLGDFAATEPFELRTLQLSVKR